MNNVAEIPDDAQKKFNGFASKEKFTILLIEDHQIVRESLPSLLPMICPNAHVSLMNQSDWNGNVEEFIIKNGNGAFLVDAELGTDTSGKWVNPIYGSFGMNIIPFIKKRFPGSLVIAISTNASHNRDGIYNGADMQCTKGNLVALFQDFMEKFKRSMEKK